MRISNKVHTNYELRQTEKRLADVGVQFV